MALLTLLFALMPISDSQVFNDPYRGMGTNLHENADWNPDVPWKDLMRLARRYVPQEPNFGSPFDTGETLTLDANGWPQPTSSQAWATLVCTDLTDHYPSGTYHLLYDGTQGRLAGTWGGATIVSESAGDITLNVDSSKGGIGLKFWPDESGNYDWTNIRLVHEDDLATYASQPFRDEWVTELKDNYVTFRFMNWGRTNGNEGAGIANPTVAYTDIPDSSWATQTGPTGVSVELMVALCNEANRNMWYCIPHQMSDAGVTAVATYIRDNLDINLRCFFELSNEPWNGGRYFDGVQWISTGFPQASYFWDIGNDFTAPATIGVGALDASPYTAQLKAYSVRMKEVMALIDTVYAGQLLRRIRVAGTQWANSFVSSTVLEHGNAYQSIDALAVGAYFGASLGSPYGDTNFAQLILDEHAENILQAGGNEEAALIETHEWLFRRMEVEIGRKWRTLANSHLNVIAGLSGSPNIKLIAYEGGQHLAGVANYQWNNELAKIFITMNKRAEMASLYAMAFQVWREVVGTNLFCHFTETHEFNNFGSWGAREYAYPAGTTGTPPKYTEIIKQAQAFF